MLEIILENSFGRDYRKVQLNPLHKNVDALIEEFYSLLSLGQKLPVRLKDHQLHGEYKGFRECHLKPDLLVIYQLVPGPALRLIRIGSHSQLF